MRLVAHLVVLLLSTCAHSALASTLVRLTALSAEADRHEAKRGSARALLQLRAGPNGPWQFNGFTTYFATPRIAHSSAVSVDAKSELFWDGTLKAGAGAATSSALAVAQSGQAGQNYGLGTPRWDRPFVATQAFVTVPKLLGWTTFPTIGYNLAEGQGSAFSSSNGYFAVGEIAYNALSNSFGVSFSQAQAGSTNFPLAVPGSGLVAGQGFSGLEQIGGANSLTLLTDPRTIQFAQSVAYPFNILTPGNPLTCTQTMITSAVSTWGDLGGPIRPTARSEPLFLIPFCAEFFNPLTLDNFQLFEQFYLDNYYNTNEASGYYEDYGLPGDLAETATGPATPAPGRERTSPSTNSRRLSQTDSEASPGASAVGMDEASAAPECRKPTRATPFLRSAAEVQAPAPELFLGLSRPTPSPGNRTNTSGRTSAAPPSMSTRLSGLGRSLLTWQGPHSPPTSLKQSPPGNITVTGRSVSATPLWHTIQARSSGPHPSPDKPKGPKPGSARLMQSSPGQAGSSQPTSSQANVQTPLDTKPSTLLPARRRLLNPTQSSALPSKYAVSTLAKAGFGGQAKPITLASLDAQRSSFDRQANNNTQEAQTNRTTAERQLPECPAAPLAGPAGNGTNGTEPLGPIMTVARTPGQMFPLSFRQSPMPRTEDISALVALGQVVAQQLQQLPMGRLARGAAQAATEVVDSATTAASEETTKTFKQAWNLTNQVAHLGAQMAVNSFLSSAGAILPLTQLLYNNTAAFYQGAAGASNRAVDLAISRLDTQRASAGELASRMAGALQQLAVTAAVATADGFAAGSADQSSGEDASQQGQQPEVQDPRLADVLLWQPDPGS